MSETATPLLQVKDLKVHFPVANGVWGQVTESVKAVDGVSFDLHRGETFSLVGESGCGKSTTALAVLRMLEVTQGRIHFEGEDVTDFTQSELRPLRRRMQMVYQDPFASLNPRMKVGEIIGEPLVVHQLQGDRTAFKNRVNELMDIVGLLPDMASRYPHEFSGGQRQRVGIARALALNPDLLICDEAVSALDVSIQAQILNLLMDLQRELSLTYLFIAHDLSVVRHISDRVGVMYLGRLVEVASAKTLFKNPQHPYTQGLLSAVPVADPEVESTRAEQLIIGEVPSVRNPPTGCRFHPRCPLADQECSNTQPKLLSTDGGEVACFKVGR
ncbi:MAG: oligopeptide transport system ATP-binding protein [Candidatus Azotimanducaceae bacterium]|jgi:oligopeptide transport system ATP-binding protein